VRKITKVLGIIIMLGVIAFVGTCSWQWYKGSKQDTASPEAPSIAKAGYSLRITNTGATLYTTKVIETLSTAQGKSIFTLPNGYWEANADKYVFKKVSLSLDEKIFGEIEVKKR
jgi:predicted negative regulator of RcsB-dependent stress response